MIDKVCTVKWYEVQQPFEQLFGEIQKQKQQEHLELTKYEGQIEINKRKKKRKKKTKQKDRSYFSHHNWQKDT